MRTLHLGAISARTPATTTPEVDRVRDDAELIGRFASGGRDAAEDAFRALVDRHGPMVWGVCRRVLADRHEAEDAFQATFLVLARKAPRIRHPELLGNWLYGVAYKVSARARSVEASRKARERQGAAMVAARGPSRDADHDLGALLHAEIGRLPEIYRAPVVLCYLEGRTNEEAARKLGCPVGTLKVRLMRAREKLRSRLDRRGLALVLLLLFAFAQNDATAAVPGRAVEETVDVAMRARAARIARGPRSSRFRLFAGLALLLLLIVAACATASAGGAGRKRAWWAPFLASKSAEPPEDGQLSPSPAGMPAPPHCH